jgi:hypothetical protein
VSEANPGETDGDSDPIDPILHQHRLATDPSR